MKKWIKILLWIIASPIVLIVILFAAYVIMNSQGVIEPFQVGNPQAKNRILIASQGSEFKENLVANIIDEYKDSDTYFSVVDCTVLAEESVEDWDVVIIIHTMQVHKMPAGAKKFLEKTIDFANIMLVSTSGGGDDVVTDFEVDAISAASRLNKVPRIIDWIGEKLENKLASGNLTDLGVE